MRVRLVFLDKLHDECRDPELATVEALPQLGSSIQIEDEEGSWMVKDVEHILWRGARLVPDSHATTILGAEKIDVYLVRQS